MEMVDPSFVLTEWQKNIQSVAYNFAVNELKPLIRENNKKETLPVQVLPKEAN